MLEDAKVNCIKEHIQYSVIPSLSQQLEWILNGLLWKDKFPFKRITEPEHENYSFEFILLTPDELELIKNNERMKGKLEAASDQAKSGG
jgi:hypothetical protein